MATRVTTLFNPRDFFLTLGSYYASTYLILPLAVASGKLTKHFIYTGNLETVIVAPLVLHLPEALAAAAAGACVAWLAHYEKRLAWAILPAVLYGMKAYFGYHWARPPLLGDRVGQVIGAIFTAASSLVGALILVKSRPGTANPLPEAKP